MKRALLICIASFLLCGREAAAYLPCEIDDMRNRLIIVGIIQDEAQRLAMEQTLDKVIKEVWSGPVLPGDLDMPQKVVCLKRTYRLASLESTDHLYRQKRIVLLFEAELRPSREHTLRYAMIYGYDGDPQFRDIIEYNVVTTVEPDATDKTGGTTEFKRIMELDSNKRTARGLIQAAVGLLYLPLPVHKPKARDWLCKANLSLKGTDVLKRPQLADSLGGWLRYAYKDDVEKGKLCELG